MTLKKKILLATMAGSLLSGSAFAEEAKKEEAKKVEAKKVAPMTSILPNIYASTYIRHRAYTSMDGNKYAGNNVRVEAKYTLGSSFMNDKLISQFTVGVRKNAGTSVVEQVTTEMYNAYSIFSGKGLNAGAYAYLTLPHKGSGTTNYMALTGSASKGVGTEVGELKAILYSEFGGVFGTRPMMTEVPNIDAKDGEKLGLTGEDNNETEMTGTPMYGELALRLSLKTKVKGLKLGAGSFIDRSWDPKMEKTTINGSDRVAMNGYEAGNSSYNLYSISYRLGNGVSISNELKHNYSGAFEAKKNGTRYRNTFKISKSL